MPESKHAFVRAKTSITSTLNASRRGATLPLTLWTTFAIVKGPLRPVIEDEEDDTEAV